MLPATVIVGELHQTPSGSLVLRPRAPRGLPKLRFATLRPQVDGSLALTPLPEQITLKMAAEILRLSHDSVYNLTRTYLSDGNPVLSSTRPSPGRMLVGLESVLRHKDQCADPEYWAGCKAPAKPVQTPGK